MDSQRISWVLPLSVLPLFAFNACGPSSENDPQLASVSVRDSAGVEVVEAPREVMEALHEWSLQVERDLGGMDAGAWSSVAPAITPCGKRRDEE